MKNFSQYSSPMPTQKVKNHPLITPEDQSSLNSDNNKKNTSTTSATSASTTPSKIPVLSSQRKVAGASGTTISKLRKSLEDAHSRDASAKAALAKSDAVILELRSSIRQLKRQLEAYQDELAQKNDELQQLQEQLQEANQANLQNHQVGELQVQLDRAHAQLLTADMVRKELEDTLEAEQYTWELRVQDQERTLQHLSQECQRLNHELQQQQDSPTANIQELQHKIDTLTEEREELQSCLDEALQELEAVDAEIQGNWEGERDRLLQENNRLLQLLESTQQTPTSNHLKELYQSLLDRFDEDSPSQMPETPHDLQMAIQDMVEASNTKVSELQAQLSVFRGDLKAREESGAELRASLKEAVALLQPLQDAVAKTEQEKQDIMEQLQELEQQLQDKNEQIVGLQRDLANTSHSSPLQQSANEESYEQRLKQQQQQRRPKRDAAEGKMKQLLRDAQARFQSLHEQNQDVQAKNQILEDRLRQAVEQEDDGEDDNDQQPQRDLQQTLAQREQELQQVRQELERARAAAPKMVHDFRAVQAELKQLKEKQASASNLQQELEKARDELKAKKESEKLLNASLKEALGLLHPLQQHLEDAEREKKELSRQVKLLKRQFADTSSDVNRSVASGESHTGLAAVFLRQRQELEQTVRQLELENSQLHDTMEEMSNHLNLSMEVASGQANDGRLREDLVELQSRYQVTHRKLEDAQVENHALVEALKLRERGDRDLKEELNRMREKLKASELELENAKYIATSALVKVEELTASSERTNAHRGPAMSQI